MKRKIYAKYNKRTKMIEFIFMDVNDEQAEYNFALANLKATETNPYYNEEDYGIICLGVVNMEGEEEEVGIIYDYKESFPFVFDKVKEGQKPKYNSDYFKDIQVRNEERIKQLKNISKGGKE